MWSVMIGRCGATMTTTTVRKGTGLAGVGLAAICARHRLLYKWIGAHWYYVKAYWHLLSRKYDNHDLHGAAVAFERNIESS